MREGEPVTTNRRLLFAMAVGLGTILSTMTLSIVNVSLPSIAEAFGVDLPTVSWVVLVYFATVSGLHLSVGRLADGLGRIAT